MKSSPAAPWVKQSFIRAMITILIIGGCSDGSGDPSGVEGGSQAKGAFLELTPDIALIAETGQQLSLAAAVRDSRGRPVSGAKVQYSSLDPVVAIVDATGTVHGISEGVAAIVGTSGVAKDTAVVAVAARKLKVGSASVAVYPTVDTIPAIGESLELQAVAREPSGRLLKTQQLQWSTSDTDVATVSNSGVVTARKKGVVKVEARIGEVSDTATLFVAPGGTAVKLVASPRNDTIPSVGESVQLGAQLLDGNGSIVAGTVAWTSLDGSVATVNAEGRVTGASKGMARIRVSSGALADTARVWVAPTLDPAAVAITPVTDTLAPGNTTQLRAAVTDINGNAVTNVAVQWSSNNSGIAAVSTSGLVRAEKVGTAVITATAGSVSSSATIVVQTADTTSATVASVAMTPEGARIVVGETIDLTAQVKDAGGKSLSGVAVTWTSLNTARGTVEAQSGTQDASLLGVSKGEFRVVVQAGTKADTAWFRVAEEEAGTVTQLAVSPKVDTIATVGGNVQLGAQLVDASGNVLSGSTLTWATLDAAIASVSSSGLVTGMKQGVARITASYSTFRDTAFVYVSPSTVPVVATTVVIAPDNPVITRLGGTTMLSAAVLDQFGSLMQGQSITWSSLDASIATVSNGLVTAVAVGQARIVASSGTLADTVVVLTQDNAPPAGGYTVDMQIVRFDGGSGPALVSSAVPLPPGVVMPSDVGNVHVMVNGQEQQIYAGALNGTFQDGSVRSVLVQFSYNVGSTAIPAQLVISSPRTLPNRSKVAVNLTLAKPYPDAVILPTDPIYLQSTRIVGPTVTVQEAQSFSPTWVNRWNTYGDPKWAVHKADYMTASLGYILFRNFYDRSLANFGYWVMSGDARYFERGVLYGLAYREHYHRKYAYSVQPHETQIEGEVLIYSLLGDDEGYKAAQLNAEYFRDIWLTKLSDPNWNYSANRPMARAIEAFITAYKLDVPGNWPSVMRQALNAFLAQQHSDGAYRYPAQCNFSNNFQTGLWNDAMIRYWEEFEQDPRIVSAIQKNNDWMWNTQWDAAGGGFKYSEGPCSLPGAGATMTPAPDLNLLMVTAFGFVYQQTRDAKYRQLGDVVFAEGIKRAWLGSTPTQADKQFNQQFRSAFRYFYYRR